MNDTATPIELGFARALLVEDEPSLSSLLTLALRKLNVACVIAPTMNEARALIDAGAQPGERGLPRELYDLILLDRGLPDGDGIELCRELRAQAYPAVILMLTAQGDTSDRVRGLNAGADDYLPKPFSWDELHARLAALARRRPHPSTSPGSALGGLSAGDAAKSIPGEDSPRWMLDPNRLRIRGERGWAELTPLEYKLASKLIGAAGSIVGRDELLKDVWGFTLLPKTRTVDHFLGRLRKLLEADPESPTHFITVRGAGYVFRP